MVFMNFIAMAMIMTEYDGKLFDGGTLMFHMYT